MIKSIRIMVRDAGDNETIVEVKGGVTKEKLEYLINNLRAIVSMSSDVMVSREKEDEVMETSYGKIKNIIRIYFKDGYFTSPQVKEVYEEMYDEEMKISTISTYLARLHDEGYLTRIKHGKRWIYQLRKEIVEAMDKKSY